MVCLCLTAGAFALGVAGSADVSDSAQPIAVSVHIQSKLNLLQNVHVSFRPTDRLPLGGYYYAVIVLKPYKHYTRNSPPPCATSSDMDKTDYGYPHGHRAIQLALTPAESHVGHWCRGGTYIGGIYAVPHPPPCESKYPCRSESYERGSSCFELEDGHKACGIVKGPKRYAYPDGLPKPLASGTRIIGRFQLTIRGH
jgi:hypothetical protein